MGALFAKLWPQVKAAEEPGVCSAESEAPKPLAEPAAGQEPGTEPDKGPGKTPAERAKLGKALGDASADFGLRLVRELGGASDVFVSPASVLIALGMPFGGAGGATKDQMASALFPGLKDADVHEGLGHLVRLLRAEDAAYDLACANRLYAQKDVDFERAFLDLCSDNYLGSLRPVDFKVKEARDAAKEEINAWAAETTKGLIDQLVDEDSFSKDTRLVLINAVYFKGKWAEPFLKVNTAKETFYTGPGKELQVDMMIQRCRFDYCEGDDVQVLRMEYTGSGELAMLVFLPKQRFGLPAWLAKTDGQGLQRLIGALEEEDVRVSLPKWKAEKSYRLGGALAALGLRDAFDPLQADFSRIADVPGEPLYISGVLHKTFVDVDEEGTEAAAVTMLEMAFGSNNYGKPPPPPKVFKVPPHMETY